MTVVAVIPARWASSRFPGKPLAPIAGKPMLRHVWERACRAVRIDGVVVATDDERIMEACGTWGADAVLTAAHHETGTDRLAEVALVRPADLYVDVQGDEPLIEPAAIDAVVGCLEDALPRGIEVATVYLEGATAEQEASPSVVHLVPTVDGRVLTVSRLPVPCAFRAPYVRTVHVGLYAYTRAALMRFAAWPVGPVEAAESMELLRFLEHGEAVACRPIAERSLGVDHPEDIARVEAILAAAAARP
jgi:3-deoxy-manno-octulosonate cytidylyltransferase (CMP-KDO synthetase)